MKKIFEEKPLNLKTSNKSKFKSLSWELKNKGQRNQKMSNNFRLKRKNYKNSEQIWWSYKEKFMSMESDTKSSTQDNWWSWTKTNTQQMTEQNATKIWEPTKQKANNSKSVKLKQIIKGKHWGRNSWNCWLSRDRDACKIQLQWAIIPLLFLCFQGHPTKSYPHMYPP